MNENIETSNSIARSSQNGTTNGLPSGAFQPRRLVRGAAAQTVLAMWRPPGIDIPDDEQPMIFDAGADCTGIDPARGVRLLGYYNASRRQEPSRGLVLVLHGWEGCSHSNYNLIQAQLLVEAGYDVFRLNLRDHGPRHLVNPYALNRGLFLGTLIEEAATATRRIAELAGDRPFYIVGSSMGGNFALRLALWHRRDPFPNLVKVIAMCPAIDPGSATDALDSHPATRRYFRQRWLRSLRSKQALYGDLYDFRPVADIPLVRDMTAWLIRRYGNLLQHRYRDVDEYFGTYSAFDAVRGNLAVPTTIIAAANDPVIPVTDFYDLPTHPQLKLEIHPTGGHCGFMDVLPMRHHMPQMVLQEVTAPLPDVVQSPAWNGDGKPSNGFGPRLGSFKNGSAGS
jgi:predicted alpha/beta-fold hydrolase